MSLRSVDPLSNTDGRSYRRAFWHNQRTKQRLEEEKKRREKEGDDRRLTPAGPGEEVAPAPGGVSDAGGGGSPPNVPADGQFPLPNPRSDQWSISAVEKLWGLLTANNPAAASLTVARWTTALNRSEAAREALGFPVPSERIGQSNDSQRRNRNYAARLYGDASSIDEGEASYLHVNY